MADPLIDDINHKIDSEVTRISDNLAAGGVSSFEDYKFRAGVIAGLKLARGIVSESSRNYLDDKDAE